jgi:hypothetical protein
MDSYWSEFQGQLEAVGFDPLVTEVKRLNLEAPPAVRYVAAWVTSRAAAPVGDTPTTQFFHRTGAIRAAEVASLDYAREYYKAGAGIEHPTNRIELDDYFTAEEARRIDFIEVTPTATTTRFSADVTRSTSIRTCEARASASSVSRCTDIAVLRFLRRSYGVSPRTR